MANYKQQLKSKKMDLRLIEQEFGKNNHDYKELLKEVERLEELIEKEESKTISSQSKYITLSLPIYTNQFVIEIRREGLTTPDLTADDFSCYQEARDILYSRKESQSTMALHEYLARDKNGFHRILYSSAFCEKFGFTRTSFQHAFNALLYDRIIKSTNIFAYGSNGVAGRVFIFDKAITEELPPDIFNEKNAAHLEIVRRLKE